MLGSIARRSSHPLMIDHKKTAVVSGLAVLLVFVSAACRRQAAPPAKDGAGEQEFQKSERPILRIGDYYFSLSDFEGYVEKALGKGEEAPSPLVLSRLFDRFAEDKLLLESARRKQILLTEEEIKEYLVKIKSQMDPQESREFTADELRSFQDKLLVDKYLYSIVRGLSVGDEEVAAFYEEHKGEFLLPERFEVSQILTDSEEAAVEILNKVKDKSLEDFEAAARELSRGMEAARGGRMGVFSRGQLPYEIERVILSMKEGEISPVVESSYGFHIFLLNRRMESELLPMEQAAPAIRLKLLDRKISQAVESHLDELKNTVDWQALTEQLPFPYQRNKP